MPKNPIASPDGNIRVLHVDDEPEQSEFLKLFVEEFDPGLEVESVISPVEALRLLEEESFDCVVSDYQMPGMDGVELARRIRETSDIPFIIYTGRGSEEVASEAFAAGVDDYLQKQVDPSHYEVLAKRIKMAVERSRAEGLYSAVVEGSRDAFSIMVGTTVVYAN